MLIIHNHEIIRKSKELTKNSPAQVFPLTHRVMEFRFWISRAIATLKLYQLTTLCKLRGKMRILIQYSCAEFYKTVWPGFPGQSFLSVGQLKVIPDKCKDI